MEIAPVIEQIAVEKLEFGIDKSSETSMYHKLPDIFRQAVDDIPPEILAIPTEKLNVREIDQFLRRNFWDEYDRALAENRNMNLSNVYRGVTSRQNFYKAVRENHERLAFIVRIPISYENQMKQGLEIGINRLLNEVLTMPIKNHKGYYDQDAVKNLMKAIEFCDARVKGAIVQRIEKKSVNVHAHTHAPVPPPKDVTPEGGDQMKLLENRMQELQMKLAQARGETVVQGDIGGEEEEVTVLQDSSGEGS